LNSTGANRIQQKKIVNNISEVLQRRHSILAGKAIQNSTGDRAKISKSSAPLESRLPD
jgi:hypothetical protein